MFKHLGSLVVFRFEAMTLVTYDEVDGRLAGGQTFSIQLAPFIQHPGSLTLLFAAKGCQHW
jgi:hypothetical protein